MNNKAKLKCPKCQKETEVEVPTDRCLTAFKCEHCGETLAVPKSSDNCCVICEYSDKKCPVALL